MDSVQSLLHSLCQYLVPGLPGSLSQRSYALSLVAFQIEHHPTWHCKCTHHFSATYGDIIKDCDFKFSMACEWNILIEKDKDNSLQFTSFPHQTLIKVYQFAKVSPPHHFALYNNQFNNWIGLQWWKFCAV